MSSASGVILTGGKSRRFKDTHGIHKALFRMGDFTFIERLARTLDQVTDKLYLSVSRSSEMQGIVEAMKNVDIEPVPDTESLSLQGPKKGVISVLPHVETNCVVFVGVDYPFISPQDINFLINSLDRLDADISAYLIDDFPTFAFFAMNKKYYLNAKQYIITDEDPRMSSIFRQVDRLALFNIEQSNHTIANINEDIPSDPRLGIDHTSLPTVIIEPQGWYNQFRDLQNHMKKHPANTFLRDKALTYLNYEKLIWNIRGIVRHIDQDIRNLEQITSNSL